MASAHFSPKNNNIISDEYKLIKKQKLLIIKLTSEKRCIMYFCNFQKNHETIWIMRKTYPLNYQRKRCSTIPNNHVTHIIKPGFGDSENFTNDN